MGSELIQSLSSLLSSGQVQAILGWARASYGLRCRAKLFSSLDQLNDLVLPPLSYPNLVSSLKFLIKEGKLKSGKLGILVKGCDSKSLNQLLLEGQLDRAQLMIIGIRCAGVIDPHKLDLEHPAPGLIQQGDKFLIQAEDRTWEYPKDQLLDSRCLSCRHPEPVLYDQIWGEPVTPRSESYSDLSSVLELDLSKRWEFWVEQLSACIRCYACRNSCSLCYCESCSLESTKPQWIFRSSSIPDNLMYHIIKAYHLIGRCSGCGECQRSCPMQIPLLLINRYLEMEVRRMFNHEPGITPRNLLSLFEIQELSDVGY